MRHMFMVSSILSCLLVDRFVCYLSRTRAATITLLAFCSETLLVSAIISWPSLRALMLTSGSSCSRSCVDRLMADLRTGTLG